jgi:two-component sensor histidine kinase
VRAFQHLPLQRKLTLTIVLTTVAAILLASAAIVTYETITFRGFIATELETTADIIGANGAAALRFSVPRDAQQTLSSLRAKPHISNAWFFTNEAEVFATYAREGVEPLHPPVHLEEGHAFTSRHVSSLKHVYQDGDFLGSVLVTSGLGVFYSQLKRSLFASTLVIVACSAVALFISLKILHVISRPIDNLIETAAQVSENRDYSLRAQKFADDDMGNLAEEFNDMLQQIQQRDEELEYRVTERTAELSDANRMLSNSLAEKVVMLKEIHHRVKNNLQVISSLLSLQTRQISDKHTLEVFENSSNRVRAMATIHEKLYLSDDLAKVDFGQYIHALVAHLFQSYKISCQYIRLRTEVENIALDLDRAVPCGLMINELVSNSLKYAFPEDRKGEILVRLARQGDGYVLQVSDDGVGFPDDVDFRSSKSLGLQLINTLVKQLHGTIEMINTNGTEVTIEFPGA